MQAVPPSVYGLVASFTAPYIATLAGTLTANRTYTFPDAAITVAGLGIAQTWTADQTFDVIKTNHCDAATSAGVHIGNLTHQDVAIFGAGGGQGSTFYGQINGTSLALSGAASCTALTASANSSIGAYKLNAGSGAYWFTVDTPGANAYSGGLICATNGVGKGYVYSDTDDKFTFQSTTGIGAKIVVDLTVTALSISTAGTSTFAGTTPGTPSAGQVLIGGGAVKAAGAVSCASLAASGSGVIGASALLASERLRVAGGTAQLPGATDVTVGAGVVWAGANVNSSVGHKVGRAGSDSVAAGPFFYVTDNITTPTAAWLTQMSASGHYDFWGYASSTWMRRVRIQATDGQFQVLSTTASTSTTTGALTVAGGLGVAGAIYSTALTVASADYIYLRGNATTDGSVRMSSPSAGVMTTESRISGTWTEIGRFG